MRATGITRKVDELGRIVLPKELRRTFDINEGDPLEIFVESDRIILSKYTPGCIFCGRIPEVRTFKGKHVCDNCIKGLKGANLDAVLDQRD